MLSSGSLIKGAVPGVKMWSRHVDHPRCRPSSSSSTSIGAFFPIVECRCRFPPVECLRRGIQFAVITSAENPSEEYRGFGINMALEWVVLSYAAAAEAIMLLLLTMPGSDHLRKGLISVARSALKPLLSVLPFCMFLVMDIYWKYETGPDCEGPACNPGDLQSKSLMKCQRNGLLITATLVLYWLLYRVTDILVHLEQLDQIAKKLKCSDYGPSGFLPSDGKKIPI